MFKASDLVVGQEVGMVRTRSMSYSGAQFSTVIKVNGHGHIYTADGKVFDKYGSERNAKYGLILIDAENLRTQLKYDADCRDRREAAREATKLLEWTASRGTKMSDEEKVAIIALVSAL